MEWTKQYSRSPLFKLGETDLGVKDYVEDYSEALGAPLKGKLALLVLILSTVEVKKNNCLKSESGKAGGAGSTFI